MHCSLLAGDLRYGCHSVERVTSYHRFTVSWVNIIRTLNFIPEGDGLPMGKIQTSCVTQLKHSSLHRAPPHFWDTNFQWLSSHSHLCVPKSAKFSPYLKTQMWGSLRQDCCSSPRFLLGGLSTTSYQVHLPTTAHNSSAVPNCAFQGIPKVCAG